MCMSMSCTNSWYKCVCYVYARVLCVYMNVCVCTYVCVHMCVARAGRWVGRCACMSGCVMDSQSYIFNVLVYMASTQSS